MSTVNVKPSRSASDSVGYALYSNDKDKRAEHVQNDTNRAAAMSCTLETPEAFVARAEVLTKAHSRKNELYSYTQNFSPDEFGKNDRGHVQRVNELGVKLAGRMHSADHLVVTHADSAGGHLHNHIYVINHDNLTGKSLQRNTSWKNGLRQANDELMQDEGCQVLPSPEQAKPDWSQRREDFASGGFERILGDNVAASLRDKRSVDRAGFTEVLDEHGVALAETQRDGWTYKMRRADNGKLGRKKASGLTPEFTAEGAQQVFDFHESNRQKEQDNEHSRRDEERAAGDRAELDGVESVGAYERRRHRSGQQADEGRERTEVVSAIRDRGNRQGGAEGPAVDLAAVRQQVAADRERREQAERDRKHARRVRAESRREAAAERLAELDRRSAEKSRGYGLGD
ncbi:MAG: relaxase/mobilization nuclease domain-containing protein [Bifidobacterium mongoliense]|nr:relaxase/mobilization nuclease domain-containing protein [Bifidobacterium mongoliense]